MSVINIISSSGGGGGSDPNAIVWDGPWLTATEYEANHQVSNDGDLYLCVVEHTSAALTEPGVGANWTDKWVKQVDSLTSDQLAAAAGTGTPSGSNKYVTADGIPTLSSLGGEANTTTVTAGESLVKFNVVYAKSDGKYWKADADTSVTTADAVGIVISDSVIADAAVVIQTKPGWITTVAVFTPHASIYLGNAGAIVETASTKAYTKPLGYVETAHQIYWNPQTGWSNTELVSGLSSDQLVMTYIPAAGGYTRALTESCTLTTQLAAHLKGLNDELISVKARLTAHNI
jgi:hypothetical protein